MVSVEIVCKFPKICWTQWIAIFTLILIPNARGFFWERFEGTLPIWTCFTPLSKSNKFWEEPSPPFLCAHWVKNTFSTTSHIGMELEYTIHYLSPNAFRSIDPAHFLYAKYEDLCLITWWIFLLSSDCAILVLIKVKITLCV